MSTTSIDSKRGEFVLAVYDGLNLVGYVGTRGDKWVAVNADEEAIGTYPDRAAATAAIIAAACGGK